jgi:hypothetical protein
MMGPQSHGVAPPPDDGGHLGSFTRPDEDLEVGVHDDRRGPDLAYFASRGEPVRRGTGQIVVLVVGLLLAIPILWSYFVR